MKMVMVQFVNGNQFSYIETPEDFLDVFWEWKELGESGRYGTSQIAALAWKWMKENRGEL